MESLARYLQNPLVRNYLKILSVDVLVRASGFILLPVYLALMTQAEFGLYGYIAAMVSTFSLVFNLGLYAAQTKLYHAYPENERGSVIFTLNAILLAFLAVLLVALFVFRFDVLLIRGLIKFPFDYDTYRPGVCIGMLAAVYSMLLINYFLTSDQIRRVQQFNLARAIFINVTVLAALWMIPGDHARTRLLYAGLGEAVVILVLAFPYIKAMRAHFHRDVANRALRIGLPIMMSALIGVIVNLSDRFFLEKFGTLEDLSKYNLALTLASVIPFAFASFQNVWLPEILKEKDPAVSRQRTRRMVVRLIVVLTITSVGIVSLFALLLTLGWIDQGYAAALPLVPFALMAAVLTSVSGMFSNQLIYLEKLHVVILASLVLAGLGIGLNLLWVPRWNVFGAALTTIVVNGTFAACYAWFSAYYHRQRAGV